MKQLEPDLGLGGGKIQDGERARNGDTRTDFGAL
jgi:hypothetical protein